MSAPRANPTREAILLLLALQQRGQLTTAEAAEVLGRDRRHTRRALHRLAEHAPVAHRGQGRSSIWVLDPIEGQARLNIYDRIALRVGRDATSFLDGTPLEETLARAVDEDALPPRLASNLGRKIRVKQEPAWLIDDRHDPLHDLLDGLLRERTLDLHYRARGGERHYPTFEPLTLVAYRRVLYVLGRAPSSGDPLVRRLRVDRITRIQVGQPFPYPPTWDPDAELDRWFGIEASREPETIVLEFTAHVAQLVHERVWHPTQRLEPLPDGGVRLIMQTGGRELIRFALEWGEHCHVAGPGWLRDVVRAAHARAAARYES